MLHLDVLVPEGRDRGAIAILSDGGQRIREEACVATAAGAQGNADCEPLRPGGHAPLGSYLLLKQVPAPLDGRDEYGRHLLLFEPQDGQALQAESFGRLALLVYAGRAGRDALGRRTQGGVRLSEAMMRDIVARMGGGGDMALRIATLPARAWWQFWKPRNTINPPALSSDLPGPVAPPLDEASLLAALIAGVVTRRRNSAITDDRDDDSLSRRSSSGGSGSSSEPYKGGGGQFGGAGASGRWDDAPAGAARPPGVDSTGRIVATAAGVAATAAVAAVAAVADSRRADADVEQLSTDSGEASDTGTGTSTSY